ncbi:rod shape-determining protein MreC [Candidatus Daviesbacteria bacterium]|nr:rod shape-determining protein MreC [Candidatus Daviesbacteria bacterium]
MLKALLQDYKYFIPLLFISLLLIFADNLNLLNLPKQAVQIVTVPIQYGLYRSGVAISRQFEFIFLARRAGQEKKALTEQLAQILSENANLRRKLAETEGFLEQQRSLDPQTFTQIAARPVGISRFLLIDKGSIDGVKKDMVIVYKDNYLGKITESSPRQSKVILPTDPDSKISVFASNKNGRARGILVGQFGSEMLMEKILHQEPLNIGDLVYTEGTEINFPRGLIIGSISEVKDEDNQIFKQAKVKPIFEVTNLDIVFVITN